MLKSNSHYISSDWKQKIIWSMNACRKRWTQEMHRTARYTVAHSLMEPTDKITLSKIGQTSNFSQREGLSTDPLKYSILSHRFHRHFGTEKCRTFVYINGGSLALQDKTTILSHLWHVCPSLPLSSPTQETWRHILTPPLPHWGLQEGRTFPCSPGGPQWKGQHV